MAELDFSRRDDLTELMDGPCSYEQLRACLRDIARVNRLTFALRPTLAWLGRATAGAGRTLRVVDVGCGYGDALRAIERWAARRSIALDLLGVDLNANAVRAAREATPPASRIAWVAGDVYACEAAASADLVISSLVTHHLTEPEIVEFVRWMERTASVGWFINDLHRQAVPYYAFRALTAVMPWHRFVKHDGPVSIRRSFVPADWRRMCLAAGLPVSAITIEEHRPARLCVARIR